MLIVIFVIAANNVKSFFLRNESMLVWRELMSSVARTALSGICMFSIKFLISQQVLVLSLQN